MKTPMLIATFAALMAAPVLAADMPVIRAVSFHDLNLQTPEGVKTLEMRIMHTARRLCEVNPALNSAALNEARSLCVAETVTATAASVDAAVRQQRASKMQTASQ